MGSAKFKHYFSGSLHFTRQSARVLSDRATMTYKPQYFMVRCNNNSIIVQHHKQLSFFTYTFEYDFLLLISNHIIWGKLQYAPALCTANQAILVYFGDISKRLSEGYTQVNGRSLPNQ